MSPPLKLPAITLDCADLMAPAAFSQQATGFEPRPRSDDQFAGLTGEHGLFLGFQRVEGYQRPRWPAKTAPQQLHLDYAIDDLDEAEATLLALGAAKPEQQPGPDRYRVLTDLAGHPFGIGPRR